MSSEQRHICIHICMYAPTSTSQTHIQAAIAPHTCMRALMHARMPMCTTSHEMHAYMHNSFDIYIYIYIYHAQRIAHTRMHTYMHACTHRQDTNTHIQATIAPHTYIYYMYTCMHAWTHANMTYKQASKQNTQTYTHRITSCCPTPPYTTPAHTAPHDITSYHIAPPYAQTYIHTHIHVYA